MSKKSKEAQKFRDEQARLARLAAAGVPPEQIAGHPNSQPGTTRPAPIPVSPPSTSRAPAPPSKNLPPPPPKNLPIPVTTDDVELAKLEAEEILGHPIAPAPAPANADARKLLDTLQGVHEALQKARQDADQRAQDSRLQTEAARTRLNIHNLKIDALDKHLRKLREEAAIFLAEAEVETPASSEEEAHKDQDRILREVVTNAIAFKVAEKAARKVEEDLRKQQQGLAEKHSQIQNDRSSLDKERSSFQSERREATQHDLKRTEELDRLERQLNGRDERITAREADAEQEFLALRRRVLGNLEGHAEKLRQEVAELQETLAQRRSAEELAWRERLQVRALAWQEEEAERSVAWATHSASQRALLQSELLQSRADFDASVAKERAELTEEGRELRRLRRRLEGRKQLMREDRLSLRQRAQLLAAHEIAAWEEKHRAEEERRKQAEQDRDRYRQEREALRHLENLLKGQSAEELLKERDRLRADCVRLKENLQERPDPGATLRLEELEQAALQWQEEERLLRQNIAALKQREERLKVDALAEQTARDKVEALEARNEILRQQLDYLKGEVDRYKQEAEGKNPLEELARFDIGKWKDPPTRIRTLLDGWTPKLSDFVDRLREQVVGSLEDRKLYYNHRDLRCFLGGLATSRLLLLQGRSGTGKTSLPLAFSKVIDAGCQVVSVQAGWRDRQDLLGYYNAFHRRYFATDFLQAIYEAGTPLHRDRPYLIVLDEINLSKVEQFFADLLSNLELPAEEQLLTLLSQPRAGAARLVDGRKLRIPPNVWFVGTANHDETTTEFADKTYDRAHILDLQKRAEKFEGKALSNRGPVSLQSLMDTFAEARRTRRKEVQDVREWLSEKGAFSLYMKKSFRLGWGNRLDRDVERFVPVVVEAGGKVGEALDHLLATKVLRKLKGRFDIQVPAFEKLQQQLTSMWRADFEEPPTASLELIEEELTLKKNQESE